MNTQRKPGIELLQCLFFIAAAAGLMVLAVEWLPRRLLPEVPAWMAGAPSQFDDHRKDPYVRGLEILNYDILFGVRFSADESHM